MLIFKTKQNLSTESDDGYATRLVKANKVYRIDIGSFPMMRFKYVPWVYWFMYVELAIILCA